MQEVKIYTQAQTLTVKEYRGQRVVTFKDIDTLHQRPDGTAKRNFNENRNRFIEGEDYFKVPVDEIRTHKILEISNKAREDITLLTQFGYLMLVKSFTDDLAWHTQRQLVCNYFDTRLNNTGMAIEQRCNIEGTSIMANSNSLETGYFNAINRALQNDYYLRRQRCRKNRQDETKLLGTYDGDFYYIINNRAYKLYVTTANKPALMRGLNAYLFNSGYLLPNSKNVDKYGLMTHNVGIDGKTYRCLAFYADKVKFNKKERF